MAKNQKKLLLEAMWVRFLPCCQQIKEWINNDIIGNVTNYIGDICIKMPLPEQVPRLWDKNLGGGSILDLGIYPVSFLPMLFGNKMPVQFQGVGILDKKYDVDIMASATMIFNDRQCATVQCGFLTNGSRDYNIMGTKGRICLEDVENICLYRYNEKNIVDEKVHKIFKLPKGFQYDFFFPHSSGLLYEIESITKTLDEGLLECKEYTLEETLISHQIMDMWRKQIGLRYEQDD